MAREPFTGLLWPQDHPFYRTSILLLDDLLQVFYGQRNFYSVSVTGRLFTGLLWSEGFLQVLHGQKTFLRSSLITKPFSGLLLSDNLLKFFYGQGTFYSSSSAEGFFYRTFMIRRSFTGILWIEAFFVGLENF